LAAAATATATLRLHTHCYIPAYREPHLGAQAIATLQALSNDRVILGIAAGYLEGEFAGLGGAVAERGKLVDGRPTPLRAGWRGRERARRPGGGGFRPRRSGLAAMPTPRCGAPRASMVGRRFPRRTRSQRQRAPRICRRATRSPMQSLVSVRLRAPMPTCALHR